MPMRAVGIGKGFSYHSECYFLKEPLQTTKESKVVPILVHFIAPTAATCDVPISMHLWGWSVSLPVPWQTNVAEATSS